MRVFRENWSAREELALVDAVRRHGLGNWKVRGPALAAALT